MPLIPRVRVPWLRGLQSCEAFPNPDAANSPHHGLCADDCRFANIDGEQQYVAAGIVTNPETATHPVFVHFNGDKGFMDHYYQLLFPGLSWQDPSIRDLDFEVWGQVTRAADLCAVQNVGDMPHRPA